MVAHLESLKKISQLMKLITFTTELEEDKRLSLAQEVVVTLSNGAEYSYKVDTPKGEPQNPMTDEELSAKFIDCARLSLPQIEIEKVLEMVNKLESLENISELMKINHLHTYMHQGIKMKGPLSGIRVLDISRAISRSIWSHDPADLGAEVIHIEPPDGEISRFRAGPNYKGESFHYLSWNRNKKNMVLDFSTKLGKEAFFDLVKISDIVLNNFRPGSMERLGADYDTLKKINPRIIYVSITGYGPSGPFKGRPAFDVAILGHSGVLSVTGEPGGIPVRPGPPLADMGGGIFAAIGALSALHERDRTGEGTQNRCLHARCLYFVALILIFVNILSLELHPNPWITQDTPFLSLTGYIKQKKDISR